MSGKEKADWPSITRNVSLPALYANARALKQEVYQQWQENRCRPE